MIPTITIFVRHAKSCKYRGDETWKRCDCRKHLRWSHNGKQYKASAKTRSWQQAEEEKRKREDIYRTGGVPSSTTTDERRTVARAIELFLSEKKTSGLSADVQKKLERELDRFEKFLAARSKVFPSSIDKEVLIEYRSTWDALYPSSATRQQVQARLRQFIQHCYESGWLKQIPKLSPIKADEPPKLPLSEKEYAKLLEEIPKVFSAEKAPRVRALVQLMRHSGLAIRDAVTLSRAELQRDAGKNLVRVVTARQKTGTDVSVPLPPEVAKEILAVQNGNQYLFWSGKGLETSAVTNWQHDLRALFRSAFGKDTAFTPHCLRDTAAVSWLVAGIPVVEVAKLLGHSSHKTTEKSYSPWVKERQDRLDSLVVGTWKGAAHV